MAVKNTDNDVAKELSDQQLDCARLIATCPGRSKEDISRSLKVDKRTVFRWLTGERFRKKVEEFRRSEIVAGDANSIYGMLSSKDKKELLALLLSETENRHAYFPEISKLEAKIMEVSENDGDPLREKTITAVKKVELLLGRLRRNALGSTDYNADGGPVACTTWETVEEAMELAVVAAGISGDRRLKSAVSEAARLIDRRIGGEESWEDEEEPEETWDEMEPNDIYDGLEDQEIERTENENE